MSGSSIVAQPWKHVYEIASRLRERGHQTEIVTDTDQESGKESIGNVALIKLKKGRFVFNSKKLAKALNNSDADIINWHGSDFWSAIDFWKMRKELDKKVVWTLHSGPITLEDIVSLNCSELLQLYKFWNNILNSLCPPSAIKRWATIPQVKHVIALSLRLKERLQKIGFDGNMIEVIRSGVDTSKFSPIPMPSTDAYRAELGFTKGDKIVTYFGPASSFRGVDTAIQAMHILSGEVPSVKLLLLARSPSVDDRSDKLWKVKSSANLVWIHGVLPEETLVRYLSISDAVVLPFKFWPQVECPLTLLEAMAMEKPIITTSVGAIPEIISNEKNGIIIPSNEPKLLASSIRRLLMDRDLAVEIGRNALKCASLYDWDCIVQNTLMAFDKVLD
jgi:glycosyltransferase involved in cell wall biosynthesis